MLKTHEITHDVSPSLNFHSHIHFPVSVGIGPAALQARLDLISDEPQVQVILVPHHGDQHARAQVLHDLTLQTVQHDRRQNLRRHQEQDCGREDPKQTHVLPQRPHASHQAQQGQNETQEGEEQHGVRPDTANLLLSEGLFVDQAPEAHDQRDQTKNSEEQVARHQEILENVVAPAGWTECSWGEDVPWWSSGWLFMAG